MPELKPADFEKCTKKRKCCDKGIVYDPADPCEDPENERFNFEDCTCERLYPVNHTLDLWYNYCSINVVRDCGTPQADPIGDLCPAFPGQGGQFNSTYVGGYYYGLRLEVIKSEVSVGCCYPFQSYDFIPEFVQITAQKELDGPWERVGGIPFNFGRFCSSTSREKVIPQWYINYYFEDGEAKDPPVVQAEEGRTGGWDSYGPE